MDDKIAAALRVMARGGANARESREAISAFKFRVIGLIEAYIKKVSASYQCQASVCIAVLLTATTGAVMAQIICTIRNAVRSCLRPDSKQVQSFCCTEGEMFSWSLYMTVSASVGNVCCLIGKTCVQVPSSPLLPAALPALLGALTGACQQGGDAALAKRLQALLMAFTKGQAQPLPSASGPHPSSCWHAMLR